MKWIKASERLPEKGWSGALRLDNFKYSGGQFVLDAFDVDLWKCFNKEWNRIEWLDETQSVTNEGASTATLEELAAKKYITYLEVEVARTGGMIYAPLRDAALKQIQELQSQLKEKEEQIRNLIEKIYPHDGGHDPCYG